MYAVPRNPDKPNRFEEKWFLRMSESTLKTVGYDMALYDIINSTIASRNVT
jgi:hypothetical protein